MGISHPKGPDHEAMLTEVMGRILKIKPALIELVADLLLMDHNNKHDLTDAQRATLTDLHTIFNEVEELVHGPEGAPFMDVQMNEEARETVRDIRTRLGFE